MAELLRKQDQVLVVGIESSYATPASPTGADAILAQDLNVNMLESDTQDRNNVTGFMGAQGAVTVGRKITTDFGVEMAGSGTPTTPPKWSKLVMACGFAELVGASDVTYTPVGVGFSSLTMLYRNQNLQQRLVGSRGKFTINMDQGTIPSFKFNYESLYEAPTVEGAPLTGVSTAGFKTPVGVTDVDTAVTFLGVPVKMKKLSIDPGVMIEFDRHTEGESVEVSGRKGSVSISFRTTDAELVAAIQNASTNAEGALNAIHGTVPGSILTVDVANLQVKTAKAAWDGEFANVDVTADIKPLSANTDLSITCA